MKSDKDFEKAIARILNGVHVEKEHYGDSKPDVIVGDTVVECKLYKRPQGQEWMEQAMDYCKAGFGEKPLVVFKQKNKRIENSNVIIPLSDYLELKELAEK